MREARALISPAMAPLKGGGGSGGGGSSLAKESGSIAGEDRWRDPDSSSSVSAVSFGFVATAILVSMFLFMALFEHFLRPRSVGGDTTGGDRTVRRRIRAMRLWGRSESTDLEANKLCFSSPEMSVYAKGVSVLMPGQDVPTFIAHPVPPPAAPCPCQPERVSWPSHHPFPYPSPTSSSNPGTDPS